MLDNKNSAREIVDTREFIAIIEYQEAADTEQTPGEYLEAEFGWLNDSGIYLSEWAIVDSDDTWDQYRRYLVEWALTHDEDEALTEAPVSYAEWKAGERGRKV